MSIPTEIAHALALDPGDDAYSELVDQLQRRNDEGTRRSRVSASAATRAASRRCGPPSRTAGKAR